MIYSYGRSSTEVAVQFIEGEPAHGCPSLGEIDLQAYARRKMRSIRRANGFAVPPDTEDEWEPLEEDTKLLYRLGDRTITSRPGNIVLKSGNSVRIQEAAALRVAYKSGIPVPRVHEAVATDQETYITIDYIEGDKLEDVWATLSENGKASIAKDVRNILDKMRKIEPPPELIGCCDASQVHDTRVYFSYDGPACRDEDAFNGFLLNGLHEATPDAVKRAIACHQRTGHRVVLSHCDLTPRNIIVKDGRVAALIDWEEAGWYPEYWEYVKFFQRPAAKTPDWQNFADVVFTEHYPDELLDYLTLTHYQHT